MVRTRNRDRRKKTKTARDLDRAFSASARQRGRRSFRESSRARSYGTPSLTAKGKFLMRMKDAGTCAFRCTTEEKAILMEAEPSIYFQTDHYVGWPIVLVRLAAASDAELAHCIVRAWRVQAPKKLQALHRRPAAERKQSPPKNTPARKTARTRTTKA